MNLPASLMAAVEHHEVLGRQLLEWVEQETAALSKGGSGLPQETASRKRALLPKLDHSLRDLRQHREQWQRLPVGERARYPEITAKLRSTQDLLMKVILRDRENEQLLLRSGRIPAHHLSAVHPAPRPHYVADLYKKHQA